MSVNRPCLASLATISLLVVGCSMAPEQQTPEAPVAEDWTAVAAADEAAGDGFNPNWREFFAGAPVLKALVNQALEGNRELQDAVLAVQRARAEYQIEGAERLPEITASAQYDRRQTRAAADASGAGGIVASTEASVGVSNYELDLFGRVANLEQAALETYLATRQARRAARISLIGEVASAYVAYAGDSARLRLAQNTLENRQRALAIAQKRLPPRLVPASSAPGRPWRKRAAKWPKTETPCGC